MAGTKEELSTLKMKNEKTWKGRREEGGGGKEGGGVGRSPSWKAQLWLWAVQSGDGSGRPCKGGKVEAAAAVKW